MSVLVFADSTEGKFKKSAFEVVSYGKKVAEQLGSNVVVVTINANSIEELYTYGAEKVVSVKNDSLSIFNAKEYASVLKQVADAEGSSVIVLGSSIDVLHVAPLLAVALDAGYASNVVALPSSTSPFTVKRKAFSNKGFSNTVISTDKKIIGVAKNSYGVHENAVSGTTETFEASIAESGVKSEKIDKVTGQV
ncbi:MAG: electron transfer flavoprotein subunit alpha/FixB family protein, partial [Flavobacteriales bacterium]